MITDEMVERAATALNKRLDLGESLFGVSREMLSAALSVEPQKVPTPSQVNAFHEAYDASLERQPRETAQAIYDGLSAALSVEPDHAPQTLSVGPSADQERLRFEGDLDKWMKIIGAGITGYQPEAYAVMDIACAELVKLRQAFVVMEHFIDVCAEDDRVRAAYPGLADRAESIVKSLGLRALATEGKA